MLGADGRHGLAGLGRYSVKVTEDRNCQHSRFQETRTFGALHRHSGKIFAGIQRNPTPHPPPGLRGGGKRDGAVRGLCGADFRPSLKDGGLIVEGY